MSAFILAWAVLGVVVGAAMLVPTAIALRPASSGGARAAVSMVVTAGAFALVAARFGPSAAIGPGTVLAVVGPPLALVDLAQRRLPSSLTIAGFVLGGGALTVMAAASRDLQILARAVVISVVLGACYLALAMLASGGLGAGDVKVAALIGLLLAPVGWRAVLVASTVTWVSAAVAALILRAVQHDRADETVPLGPFLVAGAMVGALDIAP